ncbi:ribosome maturation protein RimP [Staphylococcus gallinarum]|uniref:Ribosome maturation protein RimP n=1 Tax=Staphylococcus gallinarum TaxID=1293 RepID=A0A380FFP7_STAGA|nr:ribosome maturation protein RimP [Staphylococcus gallinarum]
MLDDLNFELVEVEFTKEGKDHFLRVSIDKDGGVDLNDCALASEKISGSNGPRRSYSRNVLS